ncbi:unnamed protein product [Malus baccata var. baccata]
MASTQNQSANVDLFDAYFRRADLDRDGQISGNEAVALFQGSGLPNRSFRSSGYDPAVDEDNNRVKLTHKSIRIRFLFHKKTLPQIVFSLTLIFAGFGYGIWISG